MKQQELILSIPTSAWFLYLGEKAYFRWVKRLRGKGKKNGLMENCFAEYWGRRHGKNDRIEKSLCIATLWDRKRFVCLFVFFKIVVKIKIRTIYVRKILIQGKLWTKKRLYPGKSVWFCISIRALVNGWMLPVFFKSEDVRTIWKSALRRLLNSRKV